MSTEIINEPGDAEWVRSIWGGLDTGKIYIFGNYRRNVEIAASTLEKWFACRGSDEYGPKPEDELVDDYQYSCDLEDLVRWLALAYRVVTYDDDGVEHVTWNLPVIATQDFKGKPLPDGERLAELFREVCGDGQ